MFEQFLLFISQQTTVEQTQHSTGEPKKGENQQELSGEFLAQHFRVLIRCERFTDSENGQNII